MKPTRILHLVRTGVGTLPYVVRVFLGIIALLIINLSISLTLYYGAPWHVMATTFALGFCAIFVTFPVFPELILRLPISRQRQWSRIRWVAIGALLALHLFAKSQHDFDAHEVYLQVPFLLYFAEWTALFLCFFTFSCLEVPRIPRIEIGGKYSGKNPTPEKWWKKYY